MEDSAKKDAIYRLQQGVLLCEQHQVGNLGLLLEDAKEILSKVTTLKELLKNRNEDLRLAHQRLGKEHALLVASKNKVTLEGHGACTGCANCEVPSENNSEPVEMLLYCPRCQHQHVDAPEPEKGWTNPPHATHTCGNCGLNWRPSNSHTTGVLVLIPTEEKHLERMDATNPKIHKG